MSTLSRLLLALPLVLASCGGGDAAARTDEGYDALGRSEWKAALSDFEAALAAIGGNTSDPQYMRAKIGAIKAKAHTDPPSAVADTLALEGATDRDFSNVGGFLMEAGQPSEAVELMDAGLQRFPESSHLAKLQERLESAAASNPALAEQLKGLGYL